MKRAIRCGSSCFALISVLVLMADTPVYAAGSWSKNVKIKSIEVSKVNVEGVWLQFTKQPFSPYPCGSIANQYWLGGPLDFANENNINQMTSLATIAFINDRDVSVYWDGTCSGGYAVLRGLTMKPATKSFTVTGEP